jgi:hypothetical protein
MNDGGKIRRTMICLVLSIMVALFHAAAQDNPARNDKAIQQYEKDRDTKVFRGLSKLKIGNVSVHEEFKISDEEGRKLLFDTLVRYNVPVQPNRTTQINVTDIPTLIMSTTVTTTKWSGGLSTRDVTVQLELWENITLAREPDSLLSAPVWNAGGYLVFGSVVDHEAEHESVLALIKKLAQTFCLSYLSAIRR